MSRIRSALAGRRLLGAVIIWAVFLLGSAAMFSRDEVAALDSVRPVSANMAGTFWLPAGTYNLEEDPGQGNFPPAAGTFRVAGHHGQIRVRRLTNDVSYADIGGPLLGLGVWMPVMAFSITEPARYDIAVPSDSGQIFISQSLSQVVLGTVPWLACMAATVVAMIVFLFRRHTARNVTGGQLWVAAT
jgi:hypothetical protein